MAIHLDNVPLSINIVNWFLENNTSVVDDITRDSYLLLKNNIEGWKKGTNIRATFKTSQKQESDKIKENLSLYLNQLSATNFNTLEKKIKNEIENSAEATTILLELILNIGLQQLNNLELLITLITNLNQTNSMIDKLIIKLTQLQFVKIDQSNYNQLCLDTRNNLIFKNGFIFLGMIFVKTNLLDISIIIDKLNYLENLLLATEDKEILEKIIEVYIEFIKCISKKLEKVYYNNIIEKLNIWKSDKNRFSNKARFAILDFMETLN
jgi:hypothetical protein